MVATSNVHVHVHNTQNFGPTKVVFVVSQNQSHFYLSFFLMYLKIRLSKMCKNHKNLIFFMHREAVDKQKLIDTCILMLEADDLLRDYNHRFLMNWQLQTCLREKPEEQRKRWDWASVFISADTGVFTLDNKGVINKHRIIPTVTYRSKQSSFLIRFWYGK